MTVKLILDLDTGIDDALAIAYALGSPELELIGVTCTYGNVTTGLAVRNSLAVLALLGRTDIPVFAGPAHASCADSFEPSPLVRRIHGDNGLGGVRLPDSPRPAEEGRAVDFIVESARRHGADLVYVPTGSSTNIAAAFEADPSLADRLRVVMMGGALTTRGNTTLWSEANISQDPEASDALLRRGRVTMVGLDVTHQTLLTKAETARWRQLGTAAGCTTPSRWRSRRTSRWWESSPSTCGSTSPGRPGGGLSVPSRALRRPTNARGLPSRSTRSASSRGSWTGRSESSGPGRRVLGPARTP